MIAMLVLETSGGDGGKGGLNEVCVCVCVCVCGCVGVCVCVWLVVLMRCGLGEVLDGMREQQEGGCEKDGRVVSL